MKFIRTALIFDYLYAVYQWRMLKITWIHFKFVYLVKLLSNRWATLSPKNLKNTANAGGLGVTPVPYKKSLFCLSAILNCFLFFIKQHSKILDNIAVFARCPKGVIQSSSIFSYYLLLSSHQLNFHLFYT